MASIKDPTSTRAMDNNVPGIQIDPKAPLNPDALATATPPQTAVNKTIEEQTEEIGATGTVLVHGILSNVDYNTKLEGTQRIRIFDEMRKGDSTVRLGLIAVKYPILAAKWYIKPPDGKEDKDEATLFVKENLFENTTFSWTQFLRQALMLVDYGNAFFEKVFATRPDGKIGWQRFAQRLPQTVYRYTFQDGITAGITQILPTGGVAEIPQWKLLMFVNELEGANYEGTSMLRAAYMPWYYKNLYYKIDAMATERQGVGVPMVISPPAATPADKAKAIEVAKNMRANEYAYLNFPKGFTLEYVDTHAKELKESKEMILHHDRQILKAFLAHFLDLGATGSGSMALSNDQSELFLQSLKYVCKLIQEEINKAIVELVDLNFPKSKDGKYPTLEFGSIGQVDFEKLATGLFRLAQGGIIVPDDDLERHVRNLFELPQATESSEDYDDPDRRKVSLPNINPDDVTVKKPIRYAVDSGTPKKAAEFMRDILTFKEELAEIIKLKEK